MFIGYCYKLSGGGGVADVLAWRWLSAMLHVMVYNMQEAPGAGASGAMWGLLFRCFRGSLVEGVGDGGDYAHALDVW